jgi:hypothetical protein
MTTTCHFSPERFLTAGFEVFEIVWDHERHETGEKGVMLKLKYAWHNEVSPFSKKRQWLGVYLQLLSRLVVCRKVKADLTSAVGGGEDDVEAQIGAMREVKEEL